MLSQLLRPGQIDVWYALIDRTQAEIGEFERLLSPAEAERARRFRKVSDRERYLVQQGILRGLLCQYMDCEPREVDIRSNSNGKPYLAGPKNAAAIQFSVSHSDDFAVYAFSLIDSIGVDIEKIREFPGMMEIVDQHFTQREKHEILSCPEDQRLILFYRFWTRKEAVLKAQGDGLLRALDSVDVAAGEGPGPWKVGVPVEAGVDEYFVSDIEGPGSFAAAVAIASSLTSISISVNFIY